MRAMAGVRVSAQGEGQGTDVLAESPRLEIRNL